MVDAGGAPDVIEDGVSGVAVPAVPGAFASAIRQLRDQPETRLAMSLKARELAEQRPWAALMAQLELYYEEAYTMNQRFKSLFGFTRYHMPLSIPAQLARRPRSVS